MENDLVSGKGSIAYKSIPALTVVNDAAEAPATTGLLREYRELAVLVDFDKAIIGLRQQPLDISFNRKVKRLIDIFLAAAFIVAVLSWLVPVIALVIIIDSGWPVFFLQQRNKRNGQVFTCIKFRSMIVNPCADMLPATSNDKRITRVGKVLRDSHLDELPQFFNVLWGDMSVIGPRPHMISDNLKYGELVDNYACRHKVKPGITGLAQVLGYIGDASDTARMKDRVNMDIFYVRHWSYRLDMLIFFRTIRKILAL